MNNEPVAYACRIVEADFETNIVKIEMLNKGYKVSAGIKYLSDTLVEKELLTDDELKAFLRFCECVEDGEGYDVPKEIMIRLSWIGVIKSLPRDYYENTEFGNYIIERARNELT